MAASSRCVGGLLVVVATLRAARAWFVSSVAADLEAQGEDAADLQEAFEVLPEENKTGWLGGDADVSVVIHGGRSGRRALWIFADTLVGRYDARSRTRLGRGAEMPCSSVALIDCGEESCVGRPSFFWRQDTNGSTLPFFDLPAEQRARGELLWPVAGIASRDGRSVLLLAQRLLRPMTVLGSTAIVITGVDVEEDPRNWAYTTFEVGDSKMTWFSGISYAGAVGDEVYIFGHEHVTGLGGRHRRRTLRERWSRTLLAKASLSRLLAHDWSHTMSWVEPGAWAPLLSPSAKAAVATSRRLDVPTWETTCTWSEELQLWYTFNVEGPRVTLWTASHVTGHWQRVEEVYTLPQPFAGNSSWLCYAAKAHPELRRAAPCARPPCQPAELVFSWICNSWGEESVWDGDLFRPGGMELAVRGYWPRFVRVPFRPRHYEIHIA